MTALIATGKRFALLCFSFITIGQATISSPVVQWASSWWINRASILTLAGVNTAITAVSEYASRSILAKDHNPEQEFFASDAGGAVSVHKQSMVNILMTIFASLLGGPIYFIRRRWHRFMFFISFGAMNSAVSQMFAHLIQDGFIHMTLGRFLFDLGYNGTIKFSMFEFARPAILRLRRSIIGLGIVRISQDFLTTLSRVGILNWLGF